MNVEKQLVKDFSLTALLVVAAGNYFKNIQLHKPHNILRVNGFQGVQVSNVA